MKHRNQVALALASAIALLAGCDVFGPDTKGGAQLVQIEHRWADGVRLADVTARVALSAPVSRMQDYRREAEQLPVSQCLEPAKKKLLEHMDGTIDAYMSFMRGEDIRAEGQLSLALRLVPVYHGLVAKCM